jgi:signal transduction histidine kinase
VHLVLLLLTFTLRAMIIDELNALVRAKDELVHLMTHELRTPLLGIIGRQGALT